MKNIFLKKKKNSDDPTMYIILDWKIGEINHLQI